MGESDRRRQPMDPKEKMNERIVRLRKRVKDWYTTEMVHSTVEAVAAEIV